MKRILIAGITLAWLLSSFSISPTSVSAEAAAAPKVDIIAHRGFMDLYPENTLPAFVNALAMGAKEVELDVQITRDGVPIVMHDERVDRTTNGVGSVNSLSLHQIKALDAGYKFSPTYRGTRVPTLREVLFVVKHKGRVYIELKSTVKPQFIPRVLQDIYATDMQRDVFITSFSQPTLRAVRTLDERMPLVVLYGSGKVNFASLASFHPEMLSINYQQLLQNPRLVKQARGHGMDISAWTVNNQSDLRKLVKIGVYRILCNHNFTAYNLSVNNRLNWL